MGCHLVNGKPVPITPWAGSWAAKVNTWPKADFQSFIPKPHPDDARILKDAEYFLPYDDLP